MNFNDSFTSLPQSKTKIVQSPYQPYVCNPSLNSFMHFLNGHSLLPLHINPLLAQLNGPPNASSAYPARMPITVA